MKKRILLIGVFIIILVTVGVFVFDRTHYPRPRQHTFVAMVPPDPIVYIQCVQLDLRVRHFTNSPEYATLLQSEIFAHMQQTAWWAAFREEFDAFWKSLIIDPMRIIGTDMAIAVYETEVGELIPRMILLGKVDQIAKIAERILYGYDEVTGEIGLTFEQRYHGAPVYVIDQPGMLCPLYYTILGNAGMIATSLPLLQHTIRTAMEKPEKTGDGTDQPSEMRTAVYEIPEQRFVAGYIELSRLIQEFRKNFLLRQLGVFQGREWQQIESFPQITLHLDSFQDRLTLRTDWVSPLKKVASFKTDLETLTNKSGMSFQTRTADPLVAVGYRGKLSQFVHTWEQFFPQWKWGIQLPIQTQDIFGEIMECKLSENLLGTLYTIPDISCIVDTQQPERAGPLMHHAITGLINQMVPPIAQRMITTSKEEYQRTVISKYQFMFQDVLCYGVAKRGENQGQKAYTFLATQGNVIKQHIDSFQTSREYNPYILTTQSGMLPAFGALINNKALSVFIQTFSQSNTFALLYPRHSYSELYQALPYLIQGLQPIPPVIIEGDIKESGEIYLNAAINVKRS